MTASILVLYPLIMDKILIENRKANYDFELLERYTAGLVIRGHEAKSLKKGGGHLAGAYVSIRDGQAWLHNLDIQLYDKTTLSAYEPKREKKLLLKKQEIHALEVALGQKGVTVVPLSVGLHKNWVKVEIATARGKKNYDKRESIKKKDIQKRLKHFDD